ncbi:S41 family peptidase [Streptomyces sp. RB6PN25]|uniref:S41 family peptidase n=1 Tax=Streptomyces humicola TaxID=2953240 RepID=A0ABT1Q1Q2_9ACTN|nr:S41 family peptidase [Streptomyces humicola]MCQ4083861.1 S41 family peptidase [Streptomyces humicola]
MSGQVMFGPPERIRRGATLTVVFGAVLVIGVAGGSFDAAAGRPPMRPARADASQPRPDTAEIARDIDQGRVGAQAAAELVSRSGDRWSAVYSAHEYESLQQELDGVYVGVGVWVRRDADGTVEVSRVQAAGPAQRAGIAVGDRLLTVDGKGVTGSPVTDVVARLRGVEPDDPDADDTAPAPRPGSPVALGLQRGNRAWTVTVRRALLSTEAVSVTHPAPGVTDIAIGSFVHGVGAQVRRALAAGDHSQGVLLDLRGNSGGLVSEAVAVASAFLDGGLVATYDVHGEQHALYAQGGGDTRTPLVVLVDGGTMSAAELLTGALQDRGRAVIVGSRTFGKGSVQMPSTLPDGSVAELTVGHYRTPTGRSIDGQGIRPDLVVPDGSDAQVQARTVLSGLGARS